MIITISLLAILAVLLYVLYNFVKQRYAYFETQGLPYLKPYFLLGSTSGMFLNRYTPIEFPQYLYDCFPNERVFGFFEFLNPSLFLRDPEIIKQIIIKDFDHFADHQTFIEEGSDDLFGNSLILLTGQKWRDMRASLSPAFTGSKIRLMFKLVSECVNDLTSHLVNRCEAGQQNNWDLKDLFSKCTNDMIASCAFGCKVNSLEDSKNEFLVTGRKLLNFPTYKAILFSITPKIMSWLNINFIDADVSNYFRSMVLDTIDVREKENIYRPDLVNTIMQLRKGKSISILGEQDESINDGFATAIESQIGKRVVQRQWTDNELIGQCLIFFLAGLDNSATILSLIMYELALNPELQETLHREIKNVHERLDGKPVDYESLQKMKYMDQVVCEILRKWPTLSATDRVCIKDYTYDDGTTKLTIDKGTMVTIPIHAIQHDPQYFPNPNKFDPERFSDENKANIVAGTYIPFGVGPRNCIGSRFALMQIKTVAYYLVLNFTAEPNNQTQIPLKLKKHPFQLLFQKGIHLELKLRQK